MAENEGIHRQKIFCHKEYGLKNILVFFGKPGITDKIVIYHTTCPATFDAKTILTCELPLPQGEGLLT
jgi:hypothetical protein